MKHLATLRIGVLAGLLLLAGCQLAAPRQDSRRAALRANAISNKRTLTESPTLERPEPTIKPQ